jgi:hypothetical protein
VFTNSVNEQLDLRFLWEATITEPHIGPAARRASFLGAGVTNI